MSPGRYLVGAVLLLLQVGLTAWAASALRRLLAPTWSGATARLAETVLGLALVLADSYALGSVGWFSLAPFTILLFVEAASAVWLTGGRTASAPLKTTTATSVPASASETTLALAAAGITASSWIGHVVRSYRVGIYDGDSIWYHLPFAARFVQDGWITRLHYTNPDPLVSFFPANTELLHAIGMLDFAHHDLLSPALNVGWLAFALLAGWVLGAALGSAPIGLAAAALASGLPVMVATQAGTARNDIAAVALLTAAVALLLQADSHPSMVGIAGAALGFALGVKVSLVVPVAIVAVAGFFVFRRGRRVACAAVWLPAISLCGCFWYLRNWVRVGNPLPWFGASLGPIRFTKTPLPRVEVGRTTIVSHLGDAGLWSKSLGPGLSTSFGRAWFAVLALALAGALIAFVRPLRPGARAVGVLSFFAIAAHLVTPNGVAPHALSSPASRALFLLNLRYVVPALTIGVAGWASLRTRSARRTVLVVALGALAVGNTRQIPGWEWDFTGGDVAIGALVLALALASTVAIVAAPSVARSIAVAGTIVVAIVAGFFVRAAYEHGRYATVVAKVPIGNSFPWARDQHGDRISFTGDVFQYPLYGSDLSNRVSFVGSAGAHGSITAPTTCATWRRLVDTQRANEVVVANGEFSFSTAQAPADVWTSGDPATRVVLRGDGVTAYRLARPLDPSQC